MSNHQDEMDGQNGMDHLSDQPNDQNNRPIRKTKPQSMNNKPPVGTGDGSFESMDSDDDALAGGHPNEQELPKDSSVDVPEPKINPLNQFKQKAKGVN